jgi:hypothetical protein
VLYSELVSGGVKIAAIAGLSVFLLYMIAFAVIFFTGPQFIVSVLAIIAAIVAGWGIYKIARISPKPPSPKPEPPKPGAEPISWEYWRGEITEFNVGSEGEREVWRFTIKNDETNPNKYIKTMMKGGFFHGPHPSIGERFEIIKGEWKESQVHAKKIRNMVTGADTWVSWR